MSFSQWNSWGGRWGLWSERKTRESHAGAEVLTLREEGLQHDLAHILGAPRASGSRKQGEAEVAVE